jgi:hypothetical protein
MCAGLDSASMEMVKINFDMVVGKNCGRGTIAMVSRNNTSVFIGAPVLVYLVR